MKNRGIVIGLVILFLLVIGYDQIHKYLIRINEAEKSKKYDETMQHVDSTMYIIDDHISEVNELRADKLNANGKIDSLTDKLANPNIKYVKKVEYVNTVEYIQNVQHNLERIEKLEFIEEVSMKRDYPTVIMDSFIYTYDTIHNIYIDSIVITDPKIVKKIKRKYL